MTFYMPAKVYAEENCVKAHAKEVCALGKKALIVTGRMSAEKNGSLKDVTEVLEAGGIAWAQYKDIEENPSVETIMKARDFGVAEGVDFVIGIGGGSPMDAAKAIALMIRHKEEDWEFLYGEDRGETILPLVLIPTTCGSGSEVTGISVLTRHDLRTKGSVPHRMFAKLALLDGKYLASLPKKVLADTSTDAFCHLTESYINNAATPYSRMCVEAGLKLWRECKDVVRGKKEATEEDLLKLLNASAFGGMAIAHTGTCLPHAMSYSITYDVGVKHGMACGLFQPAFVKEASEEDRRFILEHAGFESVEEMRSYIEEVCGKAEDVSEKDLERTVQEALNNPAKTSHAPFPVDEALLRRMAGLE
ncbi:MAG: iron-containing alcohol dehydrogenase [Lachnospiraceae bacterium]|nr:iron-containing alcohol dehydrogenase [Lachnospiraceae bacterium]